MENNKLSADPSALILGVIAITISVAGCCCGVFAVVPVILSIIGLVIANKSLQEYNTNPEAYNPNSRSNVSTAKVLNIIALVISSLVTLFYIAYFMIYGVFLSEIFKEVYEARNYEDDYNYEWKNDSIYEYNDDDFEIEEDTISIDSIQIEEFIEKELIETEIDSLNN
ncbi:CCC motif membrane protein [Psychroserpens damuponensis]|uniref:CCC motif membrane protein n=1 Tax=Psychroserpens damuponensis TaxID=943936 RepID=UPI00058D3A15|nr:CCC motif membrane protein [Psychroserpens damuponensis]